MEEQLVYQDLFQGKSYDEVVALCEKYFGPLKVVKEGVAKDVYYDSLGDTRGLARRIYEVEKLNWFEKDQEKTAMHDSEYTKKATGFEDSGEIEAIADLAKKAANNEARAILEKGLYKVKSLDESKPTPPITKEEIERRMNLAVECCPKELLPKFMSMAIRAPFYMASMGDIQPLIEAGGKFVSDLSSNINQFFTCVQVLKDHNIDLNKVMINEHSIANVCNIVEERFGNFIKPQEVIEKPNLEEMSHVVEGLNISKEPNTQKVEPQQVTRPQEVSKEPAHLTPVQPAKKQTFFAGNTDQILAGYQAANKSAEQNVEPVKQDTQGQMERLMEENERLRRDKAVDAERIRNLEERNEIKDERIRNLEERNEITNERMRSLEERNKQLEQLLAQMSPYLDNMRRELAEQSAMENSVENSYGRTL